MQVSDQQGAARRPEKRALGQREQIMTGERKGNHDSAVN
jgi:hypothetical protein